MGCRLRNRSLATWIAAAFMLVTVGGSAATAGLLVRRLENRWLSSFLVWD